jgi:hypothetical protein
LGRSLTPGLHYLRVLAAFKKGVRQMEEHVAVDTDTLQLAVLDQVSNLAFGEASSHSQLLWCFQ